MKSALLLENSEIFYGEGFGAEIETVGEVVFNTGMTGYQEVLTDASYYGQIVMMTYPLIGNYGINTDDSESHKPHVSGFICREVSFSPSNFRSALTLDEYLKQNSIPGLYDIDTRALTISLRSFGTMRGMLLPADRIDLKQAMRQIGSFSIADPVLSVSRKDFRHLSGTGGYSIGIMDLGMKMNIARELLKRGHSVTLIPSEATAEEILDLQLDGLMLSNGPGDPKDSVYVIDTIRKLAGKIPIFGICLGHQLAALALGCDTKKLKYGHRGANHPVRDLTDGRTYITSQNHGYAVTEESTDKKIMTITHVNNNDGTVEGLSCHDIPLFTVQFHPEASPGPSDTSYLFDKFTAMIGAENAKKR